ncbi:MAG: GNAT family N-acetyltransferase [Halofilum sp. (in: g-proteobacteria)]|nr:GNAT family N-acetyltransferase [Halofilum sp. (in: g-proteobacteria)]
MHAGAQAYSGAEAAAWAGLADDLGAFGRRLADGVTLVAETDTGETVAFGQLHPVDHVAMLYTAPGFTRASYASGIYRLLEEHARAAGVQVLHTEASRVAEAFFEKQGFERVASEHVRRRGETLERLRMAKLLAEPAGPGA